MNKFRNRIITASAGTGKTYRLSLEFIAIVLQYFNYPDFKLDSILALTFTKKATAEIRERILSQMDELTGNGENKLSLLKSLRTLVPGPDAALTDTELMILQQARMLIKTDHNNLQVMTIDSYISNIFRNIVRPLRSIDRYDIDVDAIDKRMPYLLDHLMKPEFRDRIHKLLVRKISRSLDSYGSFFKSLIMNRWLYFLIRYRSNPSQKSDAGLNNRALAEEALQQILSLVAEFAAQKGKGAYDEYFNGGFQELMGEGLIDLPSAMQRVHTILSSPMDAYRLFKLLLKDSNLYHGGKIRGADITAVLKEAQSLARIHLADWLYEELFLKEQEEILDIWQCILTEYDRLIYRYKNMTYDDISWFSFEALFSSEPPNFDLSNEMIATEFYQFLSHRTRFMLIDEFQDTSLIQFNILKPVIEEITAGAGTKDYGGVIVVGDEKQSIFGWRGGERELLLNLPRMIPSIQDVVSEALDSSWRSTPQMMEYINFIFQHQSLHGYLGANAMAWQYPHVHSAIADDQTVLELTLMRYQTHSDAGSKHRIYQRFVNDVIIPALPEGEGSSDEPRSIAILCRKGNQLEELQLALEEANKPTIFQPSASIVTHALVAPLLKWLRFAVYGDWLDFLAFLRSDYLRLNSVTLKAITDTASVYENWEMETEKPLTCDFSDIPEIQALYCLALKHTCVYASLREIVEICLDPASLKQRDAANLLAFLEIARNWELNYQDKGNRITDFLAYIAENATQEGFKQVSVEGEQNIQLLTIHKSKGLQFDQVFVFYDLSSAGRKDTNKLYWALQYADERFDRLSDSALTYHYEDILKHSSFSELWQFSERRALLEELNSLYVAFTRAKTRLHICFAYNSKDAWDTYISSKEADENLKLPVIVAHACVNYFQDQDISANPLGIYSLTSGSRAKHDEPSKDEEKKNTNQCIQVFNPALKLAPYTPKPLTAFMPQEQIPGLDWLAAYLQNSKNLIGDIVHYYLSFVKHGEDDEFAYAERACRSRYGSLMAPERIGRILQSCHQEIMKYSYVFDPSYPLVYTEFSVFGTHGTHRIDRLMVDDEGLRILIVDFKTGAIHEKEQLEIYARAISELPMFKKDVYKIETRYVLLNLSEHGVKLDQQGVYHKSID